MNGFSFSSKFRPVQFGALLLVTVLITAGCSLKQSSKDIKLASEPIIDKRLSEDDFGFPSKAPSLKQGKTVFQSNCASCHTAGSFQQDKIKRDLNVTTPIDVYLMLSSGKAHPVVNPSPQRVQVLPEAHPSFRDKLSRDERWAVLFYVRYLAGAGDMPGPASAANETIASIYGANCAVCHGTRGLADGPLHVGKTGNHEIKNSEIKENLVPPPARFHDDYSRMYNRTDAQLLKYVCEGIYPSAMPSWYGDVHMDTATGKLSYMFDEQLISRLIRHVRAFAYTNDLSDDDPEKINPPKGLDAFGACQAVPTNRPWSKPMKQHAKPGVQPKPSVSHSEAHSQNQHHKDADKT